VSFCLLPLSCLPEVTVLKISYPGMSHFGGAVGRAVCCRFPFLTTWVLSQVGSCGICGGQSVIGAPFSYSISVSSAYFQGTNFTLFVVPSPIPLNEQLKRRAPSFLGQSAYAV
jgi:hypothetical protein